MKLFYQRNRYHTLHGIKTFVIVSSIFLASNLLVAENAFASNDNTITIKKSNVHLKEILKEIRQKAGYDFFFDEPSMSLAKPIDISVQNGTIIEILEVSFKNQPLTYAIDKNTIIVKRRNVNTEEVVNQKFIKISGKVVDETNQPLIGVSVQVKGTTKATSTNATGNYTIDANAGEVLVFTYVGFVTQQITVATQSTINIKLAEDAKLIGEVVVTAMGISREKKSLGYSSQAVSGDAVNTVNTGNVTNALSGKVSGVQIKTNSNVGGSTNIVIRGNKSLTGDNQALWVVDGVPIDNSNTNAAGQNTGAAGAYDYGNMASDINQDDIESINVLKGAAATALYGSRAANGAIIITTKSGAKGMKSVVTFNSTINTGQIDKSTWPKYQMEYGGGLGPVYGPNKNQYFNEGDPDGDGNVDLLSPYVAYGSFGAPYDPNLMVYNWNSVDRESPLYMQKTAWVAPKNMPIAYFDKPLTAINNVSVAGSGENSTYRFSYTNYFQNGISPNSKVKRDNVSFNSSFKLSKKFTVSGNANYVFSNVYGRNLTGGVGGDGNNPVGTLRQWWQNHVDVTELKDMYFRTGRNVGNYVGGTIDNLYWNQYQIYSTDARNRFFGNVSAKYEFNSWLNLDARASIDSYSFIKEERRNSGSIAVGRYNRMNQNFKEINYDLMLNFKRQIGEKFNISGVIGSNSRRNDNQTISASTNGGLINPGLYSISNSLLMPNAPFEGHTKVGVDGVYGLASFGYDNFLYLDVTGRNDWSSTLPKGNNSYFYPSAAASIIFSELIESKVLSFGKLRVNIAKVGNGAPPLSIKDVLLKPTPFGNLQMYGLTNVKNNAMLKPESTTSFEIGVETQFFKNRLGLDISYYKTNTKDQIMPVSVSPTTGYFTKYVNAGEVQNQGVEISISGTPIKNDKFTWTANLNWSANRSKVLSLFDGVENLVLGSRINATVGMPYGTITGRDFIYHENGQRMINQTNGQYMMTTANNYIIGNVNPRWIGGLRNSFTYKNFNFNFLIDVQKGGNVYSGDMATGNRNGLYENTAGLNELGNPVRNTIANGGGIILDGVDANGNKNTVRTEIRDINNALGSNRAPEAFFVYDASYVKLREMSLSYKLPASMFKSGKIKSVALSLTGSNLWIIHKNLPYADPEAGLSSGNVQGIQTGVLPTVRQFGFGVNVQF